MPRFRVFVTAEILVTAENEDEAMMVAETGEFAHDDIEMISATDAEKEEE